MPSAFMNRANAIRPRSSIAATSFLARTSPHPSRSAMIAGSSRKMSPGWRISPSCQKAVMCFSPSPSMSKQSRDTKCRSRSTACAAQNTPPGARPAHREAAAEWAVVGKSVGLRILRPTVEHDRDDLRDHIAGALHDHRVADADILAGDLVLIVQGGALHDDAAYGDRLEHRHRGQRALAADLDRDVAQNGLRLLRRGFFRPRPTRRPADHAEPLLQSEVVDLVDHTV